ncbi:MAG: hypothetical protein IJ105_05385, partial [Bacilli bacterium]|nr:hypothetical protein [Bacilli bacterium]
FYVNGVNAGAIGNASNGGMYIVAKGSTGVNGEGSLNIRGNPVMVNGTSIDTNLSSATATNNATINSGGYLVMGKVVFVNISVTLKSNVTSSTPIVGGFPSPIVGNSVMSGQNGLSNAPCRIYGSNIYVDNSYNSGTTIIISGVYIKA